MNQTNIGRQVASTTKLLNATNINKLTASASSALTKPMMAKIPSPAFAGVANTLAHTAKVTELHNLTRAVGKYF